MSTRQTPGSPTAWDIDPFESSCDEKHAMDVLSTGSHRDSSTPTQTTSSLARTLGVVDATGIVFGIMVGTGIFASPGVVLDLVHSSVGLSLVVWVGAGILSLLGGLCFAELGAAIPTSGGDYVYLSRGLHPLFGFLFTWACFFCLRTGSVSIIALIFARYFGSVIFSLDTDDPEIDQDIRVKFLSIFSLVSLAILNLISVRASVFVNNGLVVFKFFAIALVVLFAAIGLLSEETLPVAKENFSDPFATNETVSWTKMIGAIGVATISALWAYDGFSNLNSVAEEVKNPHRNIPIAIISAVTAVTMTYLVIVMSFYCVLPASEVIASQAVAIQMAEVISGTPGQLLMPIFVALSALGSLNGSIMTGSRIFFAAARDGMFPFPKLVGSLSRFDTPYVSLIMMTCVSALLLIPGNFESLVNYFGFTTWIFYSLVVVALMVMRWREPELERPFRVKPLFIIAPLFILVSAVIVISALLEDPIPSLLALVFLFSGVPIYYLFFWRGNLPLKFCKKWRERKQETYPSM